ncbi:recombinase family protein [Tannockella kyphosi]|uniref:recombinase family protein n=1 Tax=Tannockella kyphosi TaxID=2899121 RepID=UPI002012A82B|nr:recombinase family protein [Tannockella kyphosi]
MPKKVYKAVVYCRLSKEDGDKVESNSIRGQRAFCEEFISKQKDITIVHDPIVDDGVSGVSFERAGFKELEEEIKKGKVDCVVVRDLSRFSRNYIDAGRYLEKIFPNLGIRFIAINDNYDSLTSDPQSDAFVLPFKNLINDTYCKDISVKIRSSLEIKKKNGDYVGPFCPYGYKRDEIERHRLVVDENTRETIQMIFSLFKDGMSIGKIKQRLNATGILPPMDYKRSTGVNFETVFKTSDTAKWEYNTVKRILTNDCYIGVLTQGKRGTPNYKDRRTKNKDESEWVKIENSHEALISYEDFVAVNSLLARDMRSTVDDSENSLSGFVFCADCGASMIRKTVPSRGKKYVYYICSKNKKHKVCSTHSMALVEVEEKVLNGIRDQVELVVNLEKALELIDETPSNNRQIFSYEKQIDTLKAEIERYQKLKLRLYEDYNDEIITKDEYFEFKKIYTSNIEEKVKTIKQLEKECSQAIGTVSSSKTWIAIFKEYENFIALNRRVLLSLVDKILIYENHVIGVVFKYKDEYEETLDFILKFENKEKIAG